MSILTTVEQPSTSAQYSKTKSDSVASLIDYFACGSFDRLLSIFIKLAMTQVSEQERIRAQIPANMGQPEKNGFVCPACMEDGVSFDCRTYGELLDHSTLCSEMRVRGEIKMLGMLPKSERDKRMKDASAQRTEEHKARAQSVIAAFSGKAV